MILGLLAKTDKRMGFKRLQSHKFFGHIDWAGLRNTAPPLVPTVRGQDDASNVGHFDPVPRRVGLEHRRRRKGAFCARDLAFVGFTFTPNSRLGCYSKSVFPGMDSSEHEDNVMQRLNFAEARVSRARLDSKWLKSILAEAETINSRLRRRPCTSSEVLSFCWTLFLEVKGNFPAISDDLVDSYHLLLSCIDFVLSSVLLSDRRDLLSSSFPGLPESYCSRDYTPPTVPTCIITILCQKHYGLVVEAKAIKEHYWKPHMRRLFDDEFVRKKPQG